MLSSSIHPQSKNPEIAAQKVEKFVGMKNVGIEIDHPLTKAALVHLGQIWGRTISFDKLLQKAKETIVSKGFKTQNWQEQFYISSAILLQICRGTGLLELHLFQPDAFTEVSDKPKINNLARWQLPQANNVLTLLNLDIEIQSFQKKIL